MLPASFFRYGLLALLAFPLAPLRAQEPMPLFNGKNLDGWDGDSRFWKVEDGCITGQTTAEVPTEANTFLIWNQGEVDDFEFTAEYKIEGGNSGIQVRSFRLPDRPWGIGGYQADFEFGDRYSGIIYGENFRGILADRGQKTTIGEDHKPTVTGNTGEDAVLQKIVKKGDWNEYRIVARGFTLQNYINGQLTAEVTDNDLQMRRRGGLLALQVHAGPPMKVQFRNLKLKRLPLTDGKKVVFVAGAPSHAPGDHEHRAGSMLLANALNEASGGKILATVYSNGWPQDPSAFSNADAIVMYSDGGGGHMVNPRLADVDAANERGVGIGCIHYAVEIPKGPGGDHFLKWIGGYFETDWSVNPHWDAAFKAYPQHAVAGGLEPFTINDEWYFHMRFRENMQGVTPLLTAVPPKETMNRANGPHEGNDAVRAAVEKGEPQHVAWISENPNGSRGFGFTGGHFHRNWRNDTFRRTVLNAIAWIAKADVPAGGIVSRPPTDEEMAANLDVKK
ncbi:MAG: hypothetical protein JWL81_3221 [Verrucomicrobiales bacterium]|nr:hypothetical protein [Verrucomicrobiales bacterium]